MDSINNFIVEGLKMPGKKASELAQIWGVAAPRITEVKKGERAVKAAELKAAERYFGITFDGQDEASSIAAMANIDVNLLAEALEPILGSFEIPVDLAMQVAENLKDVFAALEGGVEGEPSPTVVRSVAVGVMHKSARQESM